MAAPTVGAVFSEGVEQTPHHSPEFKARVAMEAISGRKTIQEIAADHAMGSRNAAHLSVRPDPCPMSTT
jgi:transposase-like protein